MMPAANIGDHRFASGEALDYALHCDSSRAFDQQHIAGAD
jgi:hypothetical protein